MVSGAKYRGRVKSGKQKGMVRVDRPVTTKKGKSVMKAFYYNV